MVILNWIQMNLIKIQLKTKLKMPIDKRSSNLIRLDLHQMWNLREIYSVQLNSITRYRLNACLTTISDIFFLYMFNGHSHHSNSIFFFFSDEDSRTIKKAECFRNIYILASCEISIFYGHTAWASSHTSH